MNGLANAFSILTLDAEDDKEQIAILSIDKDGGDSISRLAFVCFSWILSHDFEKKIRFFFFFWSGIGIHVLILNYIV